MQYKTILFDLDGTLTDSAPGILNSVRYGCRRIGIPVPDEATLRRFLGPPLIDSFHNLCGLNDADTDRAVAAFHRSTSLKCPLWFNSSVQFVLRLSGSLYNVDHSDKSSFLFFAL